MAEPFIETERLERALQRLPEQRRAIFLEVARNKASYDDIAEQTGLSQHQVERIFADGLCQLDRDVWTQERGNGPVRRFLRALRWDLRRRLRSWLDPS